MSKPPCAQCDKKPAAWPPRKPTFCTQKCAAIYAIGTIMSHAYCAQCGEWYDTMTDDETHEHNAD